MGLPPGWCLKRLCPLCLIYILSLPHAFAPSQCKCSPSLKNFVPYHDPFEPHHCTLLSPYPKKCCTSSLGSVLSGQGAERWCGNVPLRCAHWILYWFPIAPYHLKLSPYLRIFAPYHWAFYFQVTEQKAENRRQTGESLTADFERRLQNPGHPGVPDRRF